MLRDFINTISCGNCLDLLRQIPDESVDVTFADPPFNLKKKYTNHKDSLEIESYLEWCETWIKEMVRVTKPTGSIFVHNIPKWLTYYSNYLNQHAKFKHWIAWDSATSPMGKSLQPAHYGILYYVKDIKAAKFYETRHPHKRSRKDGYLIKDYGGKKKLLHPFGPLVSDVWTDIHRIRHNKYRDPHPCQLPVHLLERIILMSSDAGDVVLDPFMGTGTTAVAAKRLGRNYIGFDVSETYVNATKAKLKKIRPDSKIGDNWVSIFLGGLATIRDADWDVLSEYFILPKKPELVDHFKATLKKGALPQETEWIENEICRIPAQSYVEPESQLALLD